MKLRELLGEPGNLKQDLLLSLMIVLGLWYIITVGRGLFYVFQMLMERLTAFL